VDGVDEYREDDWALYRQIAPAAVPMRAEQIATLVSLIPFGVDETFDVVDVGCGEGHLCVTVLRCYPNARVVGLDGSPQMLARAAARVRSSQDRAQLRPFALESDDWLRELNGKDVVVSSLCLHHLDDPGKRRLFSEAAARLSPRGAVLIADLVRPQRLEARALFEATWDRAAEQQSVATTGSRSLYELFLASEWNLYRHPDEIDMPSPLFEQLRWLNDAGFTGVDCWFLVAGHAIYGGYRGALNADARPVSYERALQVAHSTLES
jgi:tRNA (cmo5U34)-methyltransferase